MQFLHFLSILLLSFRSNTHCSSSSSKIKSKGNAIAVIFIVATTLLSRLASGQDSSSPVICDSIAGNLVCASPASSKGPDVTVTLPNDIPQSKISQSQPYPRVEVISWKPRIVYIHNFLRPNEADYLRMVGGDYFKESETMGTKDSKYGQRTSSTIWLNRTQERNDPVLQDILERIHKTVFVPIEHGEALQIVRYRFQEKYEFHHDTDRRLARIVTFLVYLSDVSEGGQTIFPFLPGNNTAQTTLPPPLDLKTIDTDGVRPMAEYCLTDQFLAFSPRKGDALFFYSMLPSLQLDELTWHGSCPVRSESQEKWVAQRWIRAYPDPRYYQ